MEKIRINGCLKIEKENAKAMIEGFEKDGKKIHQAIYLIASDRKGPLLLTLRRAQHNFVLSRIGNSLNAGSYDLPNKYVAIIEKVYPVRNELPFWDLVCSNGLFDIWDPEGGPLKRFTENQNETARIALLRIYESEETIPESEISREGDRQDKILREENVTLKKPVIGDSEFEEIKEKLENTIKDYENAPKWDSSAYLLKVKESQKRKRSSKTRPEKLKQIQRAKDLGLMEE